MRGTLSSTELKAGFELSTTSKKNIILVHIFLPEIIEMTKISIPKKVTHETVEELLNKLQDEIGPTDLEIPIKFDYRGFGITASICMILFKWMRVSDGRVIILSHFEDETEVEEFGSSFLGFLILSTIWVSKEIVDINGKNLKSRFRAYTKKMHDRLDFLVDLPNDQVLLANFDHYSKTKGLSHWLYPNQEEFAASPSELQNTVYRCFESLSKIYKTRFSAISKDFIDDFEIILWELLSNTDQHAQKDYLNKKTLSPNTRAFFCRIFRSSRKNLIKSNEETVALKEYYSNSTTSDGDDFFFEVSVFDSGPGLVRRFLGENWNPEIPIIDEVYTVKKCLAKGSTSIPGFPGKKKGFGLNDVMMTLTKRQGFLKIRSNCVSVYRNLISNPYSETSNFEDIDLFDWKQHSSTEFTKMPFAEGALLTMAFPLPSIDKK